MDLLNTEIRAMSSLAHARNLQSSALSQRLFELIDFIDAVYVTDLEGRLVEVNDSLCQSLGYSRSELLGKSILDIDYLCKPQLLEVLLKKLPHQNLMVQEGLHCHKHGHTFPVEVRINYVKSSEGSNEQPLLLWMARDISKRKLVEAALRDSERRYRTLTALSPVGISHADPQGQLIYVNKRWCEIAGTCLKRALGEGWLNVVHEEDRQRVAHMWNKAIQQQKEFKTEYRFAHPDGKIVWVLGELLPETSETGELRGFIATTTDITKHREAEEQLKQHHLDLAHLSRVNIIAEMVSGIAHELNQPLTTIVHYIGGCIGRLQEKDISPDIIDAMGRAALQAERAGEIIHRLKDFLRKGKLVKTSIDINQTILDAIGLMEHEFHAATVDLHLELGTPFMNIMASKIHLEQLVINIALNAIEAMQDAECPMRILKVQTQITEHNDLQIKITDTGPGISEELKKQIFNPFFTTKEMGMGMGLAICRTIVEAHNGTISVHSNRGGTQFCVQLPIYQEEKVNDATDSVHY